MAERGVWNWPSSSWHAVLGGASNERFVRHMSGAAGVALETTLPVTPSLVSADGVDRLLRANADETPVSAICALCACPGLLDVSAPWCLRRLPVRPTPRDRAGSSISTGVAFLDSCAVLP